MPIKGPQSAITGYDYQFWFIAYHLSRTLIKEGLIIRPEAKFINDANSDNNLKNNKIPKINYIDDLVIYEDNSYIFYNIKYLATNDSNWTVSKLHKEGVIQDIIMQTVSFPKRKIIFVSQSNCPILGEIFNRVKYIDNKSLIEIALTKPQKKEWDDFKKIAGIDDDKLLLISKLVNYEKGYDTKKYNELIQANAHNIFKKHNLVPNLLYMLSVEASIQGKPLKTKDVIAWLKKYKLNEFRGKRKKASIDSLNNTIKKAQKITTPLRKHYNLFGLLKNSHIRRKEVDKILDWIENGDNQKLVLTGKAGCGKSVILRDVIDELEKNNVNVLGIKLDLYTVSTQNELEIKLGIKRDFEEFIRSLAKKDKLVIIFDQLDSLSFTMSFDRKSIDFYTLLIDNLSRSSKTKIILSCRSYDLNYDPTLKSFLKDRRLEIDNLAEYEVNNVIKLFDLTFNKLPIKLGKLLLNPQHLNIFCTIYDKNLKLEEIQTIQDLYNELWQKKILETTKSSARLRLLLNRIVTEMSSEQKLTINKMNYLDKYALEMKYLLSESILVEDKNIIQFFHQTFFEYCFARTFINKRQDIFKYLLSIHQGLFIRSTLKHVITFLRSVNTKEYLNVLAKLLKSNSIRFHIKYLLLNILGSEEYPIEEEWEIIKKTILSKVKIRPYFIESIMNIYWFKKLRDDNYLLKYLNTGNDKLRMSCGALFFRLVEIYPQQVLNYLLTSVSFKDKPLLIERVLFSLKNWENPESIELLDTIKEKLYEDNIVTTDLGIILEKALEFHKEKVTIYLSEYLDKKISAIDSTSSSPLHDLYDYNIEKVIDKLFNLDSSLFFLTILPLVKKLVYKTKMEFSTRYYIIDHAFFQFEQFSSLNSHNKLLIHLIEYSEKIATEDLTKFISLTVPLKSEKSLTLIIILISGLLKNTQNYVETAFQLLSDEDLLHDCMLDLGIRYKVMKLLQSSYSYFNSEQKNKVDGIILGIANEKLKKGDDRRWKGSSGYQLLNALPVDERCKNKTLNKRFLELKRKFGIIKDERPFLSRMSSVGPPIPETAYDKMTIDDWLSSFKEYSESTGWDSHFSNKRGFYFGGLVEHARMFNTSVKNNPEKYFPFIKSLITENVAPDYISEGLMGLVEANYDYTKLSDLVLEINSYSKNEKIRRSILRAIEHIDRVTILDKRLLNVLIDYALNDADPKNEVWKASPYNNTPYYGGDPLTAGINSIRGSAIFNLVKLKNGIKYKNDILDALEEVSKDKSVAVRCAAVANLNVLIKLDEKRVFKIYKFFNNDKNEDILLNSLNCLSYYVKKKFNFVKDELKACAKIEGNYGYIKAKNFVGQIIMYVYSEGTKGSKEIFEKLYNNSDEIKAGCIHYSAYLLNNNSQTKRRKGMTVFIKSINSKSESIHNEYAIAFRDFKANDFKNYYKFLIAYTISRKSKRKELHSVLEFLLKCMDSYPNECLILLKNIVDNLELDNRELFITKEPINLLIGCYNKLKSYNLKNKNVELAMNIFDDLMQLSTFRYYAYKVLEEADYS